jgi:hypothetical protein
MILVDGPSSVVGDRWVGGLNRPDLGVVALAARPGSHALWSLASSILRCLGQREMAMGATENDRRVLSIWVEAHNITDVIVNHAEHYPVDVLIDMDELLGAIRVRLWLLVEPVLVEMVTMDLGPQSRPPTRMDWPAFEHHWSDRPVVVSGETAGATRQVAAASAWEAQYERLRAATGRRLDLPYLAGFCAIANGGRDARPKKTAITALLRNLLVAHDDPLCFAQAVRGSAVALRAIGWDVTLDLRRLAGSAAGEPLAEPTDVARLGDLRLFRDPQVAAVAALASLELAREEILELRLHDVSKDGSTIDLWHDAVIVPEVAQAIMRAQRIARLRDGAAVSDHFLTEGNRPISVRRFASIVLAALEEIGRYIPWQEVRDRPAEDERWLLERGVAIRWLARLERASRRPMEALESDNLLREALEKLAATTVHPVGYTCRCVEPHLAPTLLEKRFGGPARRAPQPASHPWRRW